MSTDNEPLAPCPFCGSVELSRTAPECGDEFSQRCKGHYFGRVECNTCWAQVDFADNVWSTRKEAATEATLRWNRRPSGHSNPKARTITIRPCPKCGDTNLPRSTKHDDGLYITCPNGCGRHGVSEEHNMDAALAAFYEEGGE